MSFPRGQTRQATGGAAGGGRGGGGGRMMSGGGMWGGGAGREFTPVPKERRGQTIRRILAFFRPYRLQVAVVLVAIIATSLIGLVNPILLKLLIDEAIPEQDFFKLNLYVGLMIILPIFTGLIGVGQAYLNNLIGQNVMQDLRGALYTHLQNMPLRFFTETRTGEIQSRIANDIGGVQSVVTDTASSVTSNLADRGQHGHRDVPHRLAADAPLARPAPVLHVPDVPRRQGPPRGQRPRPRSRSPR